MERKGHAAHHTTAMEAQNRRLTIVRVITIGNRLTYCGSLYTSYSHSIQVNVKHRRTALHTKWYKAFQSLILKLTTTSLQSSVELQAICRFQAPAIRSREFWNTGTIHHLQHPCWVTLSIVTASCSETFVLPIYTNRHAPEVWRLRQYIC